MDKPQGSFEKMAENVVDPFMQPEIILTENDVPGARLTKDLADVMWMIKTLAGM